MHVGWHGGTSVSYPPALAQATNDRIAKEKGAALWHWVTADHQGHQSRGVQPYQYPFSGYQLHALNWAG